MKISTTFLVLFFLSLGFNMNSQISSYEEIEFEADSVKSIYKPSSQNFVYIKSKKGSGGVPQNERVDSILETPITELVLVFTETTAADIESREDDNRARWENLFETYPELFQNNNTVFKNVCQCNYQGDAEALKVSQGFYMFFKGSKPKVEAEPVKAAVVAKTEPVTKSEPVTKTEPAVNTKVEQKKEEKAAPVVEKVKEKVIEKEPEPEAEPEAEKEEPVAVKTPRTPKPVMGKKRPGYEKPRKARDAKACRQPCYQGGDDDLVSYFNTAIILTKKQKKKGKNILVQVRIQFNYDGSIKKAYVQGENEVLNQQVQGAIDQMGYWNPAVKGGITVKSEIRFNLKFDKATKSLKPMDFLINPRPGPKCSCMSDSELFGD